MTDEQMRERARNRVRELERLLALVLDEAHTYIPRGGAGRLPLYTSEESASIFGEAEAAIRTVEQNG